MIMRAKTKPKRARDDDDDEDDRKGRRGVPEKRRSSGFVYKARSAEDVKKRAEQTGGRFDSPFKANVDVYRPQPGDNVIRILPPTWDDYEHYGFDLWVHPWIGPDNSTYLCPRKMLNKACPICEAAKEAQDAGDADEAKSLQPRQNIACWVLNRDENNGTPSIYSMSWTMDRDIASLCYNKRTGKLLLIDHPEKGFDLTIKRTGQGLKTRYHGLAVDRDPSPIDDDDKVQTEVLEFIKENPIPDVLQYHDAKYLANVLQGTSEAKDDDLDEDEDDKKSRKSSRKSRDDDDEQDDDEKPRKSSRKPRDDDDEQDDDEDDEKPRRSASRKSRDDDDPDEDPDEDEKPRRSAKKSSRRDDDDPDEDPDEQGDDPDEDPDEQDDDDDAPRGRKPLRRVRPTSRSRR